MQVIAAIDLWEGQVVRLRRGEFSAIEKVADSPLHAAQQLKEWGMRWWHIVDLSGAKAGGLIQRDFLSELRRAFPEVKMNLGGGLRSIDDIDWGIKAGFDFLVIGSLAIEAPGILEELIQTYGAERFILAADVRGGYVAYRGWQAVTPLSVEDFIQQWQQKGVTTFLCTHIDRDGMLGGPDISFYQSIQNTARSARIIASGGIRHPEDLDALAKVGISAAVVGKALYANPTAWRGYFSS
ncbi:MAG: 1-(5-phosphoribosyl)-5-[(5-phosphoribosylamino)methylideneamino] imidazole-4-carboxamide isomerase [Bacteroidia bacterium]|nr:1-(5-phosphoribosyl)-5-[(5-phosphoribosylamino)methylideneamino] imidazole-4-carboxamide isomerase [Bacteroidia bacterium]MCX7651849.1 1-(5-phosphoribosyl)-5-[(5-phosphoribosylamino)methylideneamino] imidazole-4-carboxamide isomerase [Bacteroidia bacterium]MDW8416001.1 1-(5-phosphoribosyl)-5-[(5-phosphoribosylamino)methylideneamino] imidazole-4-carboxamide isomerase [Bacteroidia bacterium]